MKRLLFVLALIMNMTASNIYAQDDAENDTDTATAENDFGGKQEDPEMQALKEWIRNKRLITVKEIGGDLSLSGEVRTEMQTSKETKNGIKQRGRSGVTGRSDCAFDAEVNVMLDYRTERTWASIKLEFDNDMGTDSGTTNKLSLERAYLGRRLVPGETFVLDAEIGRRYIGNVFDSKIEFSSLFDGILFKFNKAFESIGNFYFNMGSLLVNDKNNHYGFIGELGFLRIGNTGIYTKFSVIDWKKHYSNKYKNRAFNYVISQLILGYQGTIPKWDKFLKIYSGVLVNHLAKKHEISRGKRANWAGYIGVSLGQIRRKGDWAFDTNFQLVQAQAIPDFDCGGIKRGNAAGVGFYTKKNYGVGAFNDVKTAVGSCNYKGWQAEFLYAITNNLTLLQNVAVSKNLDGKIGPMLKYCQYEIEFIYGF